MTEGLTAEMRRSVAGVLGGIAAVVVALSLASPDCEAVIATGEVSLIVIVAPFVPVAVALPLAMANLIDAVPLALPLMVKGTPTSGVKPAALVNVMTGFAFAMTSVPDAEPENAGSVIVATT